MQFRQHAAASARQKHSRSKSGKRGRGSVGGMFVSDRARFGVFIAFLLLVALTGGGSRPDIQSLIILRPAAVLMAAYALIAMTSDQFRQVRGPLLIVAALMALALLQVFPLPAAVWAALPHRDLVAQADSLVGLGEISRPLSLDPDRTWNTFFALFVPLAAISLAGIQAPDRRRLIVPLLMGVGMLSAALGFLQAIGGNGLHLYRITHTGFPVGLFANKNHQSILLLWVMIAGSWLAASVDARRHSAKGAIGGALAIILVLFPLLILTGSRAGLLLSLPALALSTWLLLRSPAMAEVLKRAGGRARVIVGAVLVLLFTPLLFVFGVLATSDRMTALSRLFEVEATEELRWQYMSILERMAFDFVPFGSGFGSFEKTFNLYEPAGMLTSRYMNQAHNDFMQIVIEGGLPGLAILAAALVWFGLAIWRVYRSPVAGSSNTALFYGGSIAMWLAASLVDYPMRTPLAAMLVATLTAWFSMLSTRPRSEPEGRRAGARRASWQGEEA